MLIITEDVPDWAAIMSKDILEVGMGKGGSLSPILLKVL